MESDLEQKIIQDMHAAGLRVTPGRLQILAALNKCQEPLTMEQLIAAASKAHFSSVYRSVESLVDCGIVKAIPFGDGLRYNLGEGLRPHEHYATCNNCGESQVIDGDEIEVLALEVAATQNMFHTDHHFELRGVCAACYGLKG